MTPATASVTGQKYAATAAPAPANAGPMAAIPALTAGISRPTAPTAATTAPAAANTAPRASASPSTAPVTPGAALARRCRPRTTREMPAMTGVTTGSRVRPSISNRFPTCCFASANCAPISAFIARAISVVVAVPAFMAVSTDSMFPWSVSMPAAICSTNLTASSEPKAFLICTCAAAWDRSGKRF